MMQILITFSCLYETSRQSRFNARCWMLGAGALGQPRGRVWGGRREEGSGWGVCTSHWSPTPLCSRFLPKNLFLLLLLPGFAFLVKGHIPSLGLQRPLTSATVCWSAVTLPLVPGPLKEPLHLCFLLSLPSSTHGPQLISHSM